MSCDAERRDSVSHMTDASRMPRLLGILGILSVLGVFAVNALGFLDHDTHSGQGCGAQWPLCHGSLIPTFTHEAVLIEWTHRVLSLVFFLILTAFLIGMRRRYRGHPTVMRTVATVVVLLLFETALCTLSVLWTLPAALLGLLALGGLLVQALLGLLVLAVCGAGPSTQTPRRWARIALLLLLLYLYAGAYSSYHGGAVAWLTGTVHALGILLALTGLVWAGSARTPSERRAALAFAIPALLATSVAHFSRMTVLGDLGVVLWLSWLMTTVLKACLPPIVFSVYSHSPHLNEFATRIPF